ncbi:hypothetical protein [Microcoleus sp. CAWBG58]|nr:hypothetical protein [Microcoleus sp. CAWBG58]
MSANQEVISQFAVISWQLAVAIGHNLRIMSHIVFGCIGMI